MKDPSSSQIVRGVAASVLASLVCATVIGLMFLWKTAVAREDVQALIDQRLPQRRLENIENRLGTLAVEQARQGAILERIEKNMQDRRAAP